MLTIFLRRRRSRGCSRLANTRLAGCQWSQVYRSGTRSGWKFLKCLLYPGYSTTTTFLAPRLYISRIDRETRSIKKSYSLSLSHPILSSFPSHFTFQPCFLRCLNTESWLGLWEKVFLFWILPSSSSSFFFFFFFSFFASELFFFFPARFTGSEHGSRDDISAYGGSGPTTKRGTSPSATFGASDAKRAPPASGGRTGWWSSASEKLQQQRGGAKHTRVCERRAWRIREGWVYAR